MFDKDEQPVFLRCNVYTMPPLSDAWYMNSGSLVLEKFVKRTTLITYVSISNVIDPDTKRVRMAPVMTRPIDGTRPVPVLGEDGVALIAPEVIQAAMIDMGGQVITVDYTTGFQIEDFIEESASRSYNNVGKD